MRIILPALIAAATIIGCAESASGPDSKIPAADANALRSLGFALADVQDGGDVYVLEGDMAIPKLGLREYQPIDAAKAVYLGDATPEASRGLRAPALGGAPRRQAYTRVSPSRIRNIKVDLSGLNSYPVWKTAAQQALAHWTDIVGSAIVMTEGTPGDIRVTVESFGFDYNTIAIADFPWSGTNQGPGPRIRLSQYFANGGGSMSGSLREEAMTHELGHTIGLRHTNWQTNGESAGNLGANFVPGTNGGDISSVMHSVNHLWEGFTPFDQRAAIWLYGDTAQISIAYNTGGGHQVSWTSVPGATSYGVYLSWVGSEYYYDPNNPDGSFAGIYYGGEFIGTTTYTTFLDTGHPYTGASTCWRHSYPEDPNYSGGDYTFYYEIRAYLPNGETYSHNLALVCSPN